MVQAPGLLKKSLGRSPQFSQTETLTFGCADIGLADGSLEGGASEKRLEESV